MATPVQPVREVRVVALGASAGGIPALTALIGSLPRDLAAAVFVVLHLSPSSTSALPSILDRAGPLPAAVPRDREHVVSGQIYVAPPDRHLLVEDSIVRVTRGPWENGRRPSVDVLFRSVAKAYGPQAVGIVLSGALDDGASGLAAIERAGGVAFVQDPHDAGIVDMPLAALASSPSAEALPARDLAARVTALAGTGPPAVPGASDPPIVKAAVADAGAVAEIAIAEGGRITPEQLDLRAAGLTCPDCNGSLFDTEDPRVDRFRCRVGHSWTADALMQSHGRAIEHALYTALRVLEDRRSLQDRLATRASRHGRHVFARGLETLREEQDRLIATLRAAIAEFGSGLPQHDEPGHADSGTDAGARPRTG